VPKPTGEQGRVPLLPPQGELEGLAPDVEAWIQRYVPRTIPRDLWDSRLRSFVVPALLSLRPSRIPVAARDAWILTRLAAWCFDQGLSLDPEVVLDPDTVERFASLGLGEGRTSNTYRAILRRIGPILTSRAPWEPRPRPLSRRTVAAPYSADELDALSRDARHQSTPARRRAARALLVLGAGAGLDGRWALKVRGSDVLGSPDAFLVQVGPPTPRKVPVLAGYEAELLDLAALAGEDLLIGGRSSYRNRASDLTAKFEAGHGSPRFSCSRLRSTWLVHHLALGTRLPELAAAAGLSGVTVLSDLLAFVSPLSEEATRRMLRGPA
jgi:hypothetical protein